MPEVWEEQCGHSHRSIAAARCAEKYRRKEVVTCGDLRRPVKTCEERGRLTVARKDR